MTKREFFPTSEVTVGTVIDFLGTSHLITEIEPYTHPTLGPTHGIAKDGTGWGVALHLKGVVQVIEP